MQIPRKRLLTHGLLDLVLIVATLRQSNIFNINELDSQADIQGDVLEDGPFVGIVPTLYLRDWEFGGVRLSQKALSYQQEPILDEYDNIMRDIRRRAPVTLPSSNGAWETAVRSHDIQNDRMLITMILRAPNGPSEPSGGAMNNGGGTMVANRNHNIAQGGAVGGFETEHMLFNDNFDLFNNFTPAAMAEDDISSLLMTNSNESATESAVNDNEAYNPDTRWQQFLLGYNSTMIDDSLPYCSCAAQFGIHNNMDILNEAVLNSEIFTPPSARNDSDSFSVDNDNADSSDIFALTRQQVITEHEWNTQNHEDDLLFPMLPPPSYEDVVDTQEANLTQHYEARFSHMHDHNYYNSSAVPVQPTTRPNRGYEIRSRQQVATRVITIPARQRHQSEDEGLPPNHNDVNNNEATLNERSVRQMTRTITTGSDSGLEGDLDNEIASPVFIQDLEDPRTGFDPEDDQYHTAASSSYFKDFTKDVGKHRKSVDLNALYQQDIDLGVDWLSFEPVKNIKEVQSDEEKTYDLENFIVDGETGEYLPIQHNKPQEQQQQTENVTQNVQSSTEIFNIDECLDFLQTSITSRTNKNVYPMSEPQRTSAINSMTSLINTSENVHNTETINHGLWDDIATLSELTGIEFSADEEDRSSLATDISPQTENRKSQYHDINQYHSNTQIQQQMPEQQQQQTQQIAAVPTEQYYNQRFNYPTPPYSDHETPPPPNYTQPSAVSFPPDNEIYRHDDFDESDLLMAQQDTLLAQLDNSHIANSNTPPPVLSTGLPLPGQWFLGREEPSSDFEQVLKELDILNNMQTQQSGPYLNPPNAPYVPPPINEMNVTQTPEVHVMAETYESDSGISVESSTFGVVGQRVPAYMDMDTFEKEPPVGLEPKVKKTVNNNHTYAGKKSDSLGEKFDDKKTLQRESRDLRKARELNLPFTLQQIIHTQVEEYNELLAHANLTPAQQSLVRDIRRRGKNKVAAQNCRKRKIETISSMEIDIDELNMKKELLVNKQKEIEMTRGNLKKKYAQLYQQIFRSLRDDSGRSYDPSRYSLEQVEGAIILVPMANNNRSHRNDILVGSDNDECMETNQVSFFDLSKVKVEKAE